LAAYSQYYLVTLSISVVALRRGLKLKAPAPDLGLVSAVPADELQRDPSEVVASVFGL
jgi:hypothetical protein